MSIPVLILMLSIFSFGATAHAELVATYHFNHNDTIYDVLVVDSLNDFPDACPSGEVICGLYLTYEGQDYIIFFVYTTPVGQYA